MLRYSFGDTPDTVILEQARTQCPSGLNMTIRSQSEWAAISAAVNEGIDSHLEAVTERSKFDNTTGECLVHPEELHVLLRRLAKSDNEEARLLRMDMLSCLDIEEV